MIAERTMFPLSIQLGLYIYRYISGSRTENSAYDDVVHVVCDMERPWRWRWYRTYLHMSIRNQCGIIEKWRCVGQPTHTTVLDGLWELGKKLNLYVHWKLKFCMSWHMFRKGGLNSICCWMGCHLMGLCCWRWAISNYWDHYVFYMFGSVGKCNW